MSDKERTLAELEGDLAIAHDTYTSAVKRASLARNEETSALNALNEVQKAISAKLDKLRSRAPNTSEWGSPSR